jgi:outer membrane protein OmpA-like peptidoglycan-associated protein
MKKRVVFLSFCLIPYAILGQKAKPITFTNPSFEDSPKQGQTPIGWLDCSGSYEESPPDVQPNGVFGVVQSPQNGGTFLGLVVRDNNTVESVGQRLKTPLLKDVTYEFSLWACRSEYYNSISRSTNKNANYNTPATLELWAANEDGSINQKLAESNTISQTDWGKFDFEFTPTNDYVFFIIKAFHTKGSVPYNGNVLVDNISDITPKKPKKEAEKPILLAQTKPQPNPQTAQVSQKPQTVAVKKAKETIPTATVSTTTTAQIPTSYNTPITPVDAPVKTQTAPPQPTKTNCPIPAQPKATDIGLTMATLQCAAVEGVQSYQFEFQQSGTFEWQPLGARNNTLTLQNLKPASKYFIRIKTVCDNGQSGNYSERIEFSTDKIFTIPDLLFASNSAVLPQSVYPKLNDIVKILKANPSLEIEVGGHTNTKTSGDYAKELSEKRAISVKHYFVTQGIPTERMRTKGYGDTQPISTNDTKNQRVEIRFF